MSLEAQREAIEQFASRSGIEITQWFEEKQTAAKGGRPVFGEMLKLLKRGRAAGIVMHKIDRSARNFADWAKIGDLADAGIDVHFATETLDFRSRGGRLSADIQAVIAADYIRNLREEIRKGLNGRLKQGLYPWNAPLGYCNNGKGKPKTPDPLTAPLIRELFELYGTGNHSIRSLREEMNRRGLRNTKGRTLSKHNMETILSNPFYCGLIRIRATGDTFKGCHKPLIAAALYQRVQDIKAGKVGKKVTKHNHTYRGLFRCALCGFSMIPERQKGRVYYRCHTTNCPTTTIREDQIEKLMHHQLEAAQLSHEAISEMETTIMQWPQRDRATNLLDGKKLQLSGLDGRMGRLTDALIGGLVDEETFRNRKAALVMERQRLLEEIDDLRAGAADHRHLLRFLELTKNLADIYISAGAAEKRQIVQLTTSNRLVSRENVELEPQGWLLGLQNLVAVPEGGDHRPKNRTSEAVPTERVEQLIALATSVDLQLIRARLEELRIPNAERAGDDLHLAA